MIYDVRFMLYDATIYLFILLSILFLCLMLVYAAHCVEVYMLGYKVKLKFIFRIFNSNNCIIGSKSLKQRY